jgi:hypothetical protein
MKPNLMIFCLPLDDHDEYKIEEGWTVKLIMIDIAEDGTLARSGRFFTVNNGDPYENIEMTQIVFAEKIDVGSQDRLWITLFNEAGDPIAPCSREGLAILQEVTTEVLNSKDWS